MCVHLSRRQQINFEVIRIMVGVIELRIDSVNIIIEVLPVAIGENCYLPPYLYCMSSISFYELKWRPDCFMSIQGRLITRVY